MESIIKESEIKISKIKHTIFTPIYNRKDGIILLYEKIKLIEYPRNNFEWLIIDDGSTDNLYNEVERIISENIGINIRYYFKPNGGIHTAQNYAIKKAFGEYITRIDSDDYLLPDSLREKDRFLEKIPFELKHKVIGVVGLCLNLSDGTIRGARFPNDEEITTGIKLIKKGVYGDRNYCMRTELMLKYLITEYADTKWVPEGNALWIKIDRDYLTYFVNIPFSVCAEPNNDSVSGQMKKMTLGNVMSIYYETLELLNYSKDLISTKCILYNYIRFSYTSIIINRITKKSLFHKINKDLLNLTDKILVILFLPIGWFLYLIKKTLVSH